MARLRFTGTYAHRLTAGGVVLADVEHGTVFECPDAFVGPIIKRGTPVEVVTDEVPQNEPVPAQVAEPEVDAMPEAVVAEPEAVPAQPSRSRRRR